MTDSRPTLPILLVGVCLLPGLLVCCRAPEAETPAASRAVVPAVASPERSLLPPPSDMYQVIGWQEGLNSYVIKYNNRFYRGGHITGAEGVAAIRKWGVKTVISVTPTDEERKLVSEAGLKLVEIPFTEKQGLPEKCQLKFLKTINTDPGPFYVHCKTGKARAGMLMALYRMKLNGWPLAQSAAEFERLGGNYKKSRKLFRAITDACSCGE